MARRGGAILRGDDLQASAYREIEHAGFLWLATEEGVRFIAGVNDWSPQWLAESGWESHKKRHHKYYVANDQEGMRYLVKVYPPEPNHSWFYGRRVNRARNEFTKTLITHRKEIPTVLPLAVGEAREDKQWGIIIYPFLVQAIPLERVYEHRRVSLLSIRERQSMEKTVGRMVRHFIDRGAYPVDAHLDHFLVMKTGEANISVYYVDLERIGFSSLTKRLLMRRKLLKTMGRLIARLEWLRASGCRINRPSMMRMGCAFFGEGTFGTSRRRLRRGVIQAAKEYWYRRKFHARGPYKTRSRGLPYSFEVSKPS
jgi:hypothetical protein